MDILFKIRSPDAFSEALVNGLFLGEGNWDSPPPPFLAHLSIIVSNWVHVSLCTLSSTINNLYSLMG